MVSTVLRSFDSRRSDLFSSLETYRNILLITVHPGHVSPGALSKINTVIVVERATQNLLREFAQSISAAAPPNG